LELVEVNLPPIRNIVDGVAIAYPESWAVGIPVGPYAPTVTEADHPIFWHSLESWKDLFKAVASSLSNVILRASDGSDFCLLSEDVNLSPGKTRLTWVWRLFVDRLLVSKALTTSDTIKPVLIVSVPFTAPAMQGSPRTGFVVK
jgi:hypothetical protein